MVSYQIVVFLSLPKHSMGVLSDTTYVCACVYVCMSGNEALTPCVPGQPLPLTAPQGILLAPWCAAH